MFKDSFLSLMLSFCCRKATLIDSTDLSFHHQKALLWVLIVRTLEGDVMIVCFLIN